MRVKRQHYVPQMYLRAFTEDGNRVWVYDKTTDRAFISNITGVACECGFYDLPPEQLIPGADTQFVERLLSKEESRFAHIIQEAIALAEGYGILTEEVKIGLAEFMVRQHLRTSLFRRQYNEMGRAIADALKSKGVNENDPGIGTLLKQQTEIDIIAEHVRFLLHPDYVVPLVEALLGHAWLLGRNTTRSPLFTSDSPVIKHGHYQNDLAPNTGFASPGIEVALPLSPFHLVIAVERSAFSPSGRYENSTISLDYNHIRWYQGIQIAESSRWLFTNCDRFQDARSFLAMNPQYKDEHRQRFQVVNAAPG